MGDSDNSGSVSLSSELNESNIGCLGLKRDEEYLLLFWEEMSELVLAVSTLRDVPATGNWAVERLVLAAGGSGVSGVDGLLLVDLFSEFCCLALALR